VSQPKKPPPEYEDRVLGRMLAMPPEPHATPKAKKKQAKKPPKK